LPDRTRGWMLISVVIPAHNAGRTLANSLAALEEQTLPRADYQIIVVDDGSIDDTADVAGRFDVTLVRQPHAGASAARNAGLASAQGDLVLFTEADCEPAPDWIERMAAAFDDPLVVGVKGVYRTRQQSLVARFVQVEYQDKYDRMEREPTIDFVDTYAAGYRREVLLSNDGFDEAFPHLGDQELSFRLARRGYRLVFRPDAVVYHQHNDTLRGYLSRKFVIGFWKAQVGRRYPDQLVRDSHTPQVVKLQMVLLALAGLLAAGTLLWWPSWLWAIAALLAFLVTTMPFTLKALRRDPPVGAISPVLLLARALALAMGYGVGLVRPQGGIIGGAETTISGGVYWLKRVIDVFGALFSLLLTLPFWPLIALAIKLDSPGPVIFRQVRIGAKGKPFTILKFRSMVTDAEERLDDLIDLDSLESPAFKLVDDPRVTRVGRFLRRASLDELPQLWNVLLGDMSLVGPRPEEARVVDLYSAWHRRRLAVKPGITGPMQVNGRGDLSLQQRLELEIAYIENFSLGQDLKILLRTIPVVLSGRGAH